MKILVLDGPNLNLLGRREPDVYGTATLASIREAMEKLADELGVEVEFFQTNSEGELVERIHQAADLVDGIVINPGGLTHYSVVLLDALLAVELPCVEVHLTNLSRRDELRHRSVIAAAAAGRVEGFGPAGYRLALAGLVELLNEKRGGTKKN